MDIVELNPGQSLLDLGQEPAMFVVLRGALEIEELNDFEEDGDVDGYDLTGIISTGNAVGHLSLITGAWSDWYVRAPSSGRSEDSVRMRVSASLRQRTSTILARISRACYMSIAARFPDVVANKAKRIIASISPMLRILDLATKWVHKEAGKSLWKKNHGRLICTWCSMVVCVRPRLWQTNLRRHTEQNCRGSGARREGHLSAEATSLQNPPVSASSRSTAEDQQ